MRRSVAAGRFRGIAARSPLSAVRGPHATGGKIGPRTADRGLRSDIYSTGEFETCRQDVLIVSGAAPPLTAPDLTNLKMTLTMDSLDE